MATTNLVAEPEPSPLQQQRQGEREPTLGQAAPPLAGPPSPAMGPPAPPPQASLESTVASLEAQNRTLADDYVASMQAADERYNKAEAEMRDLLGRRQEALQPMREMFAQALGRPTPPAPEVPKEIPLPNTGARPFLEGLPGESTATTLNRMLTGLSLIAQMGVGVGTGFSRGALAAYTGALEGWQHGDKQRAENEWAQYLQQTAAMQRDYKNRRRAYDDIIEANKWDLQKMQLQLGMKAAEFGEEKEAIQLGFTSADAFQKKVQVTGGMLAKLQGDLARATTQLVLQKQQQAHAAELQKERIASTEQIARERIDAQRDIAAQRAHELQISRETRDQAKRDIPVQSPGGWFDKATRQVMPTGSVTRGDLQDDPKRFTNWSTQAREQWDQANREMVMLNRLAELTPGLLAKHGTQNLMQALQLRGEQKLALAPDLREFANLNEESNFALARVLSGGVPRVAMLNALRTHVGAKLEDTIATALRSINAQRTTMRDFIEQKEYPGEKLTPHRHVSTRDKTNVYWQVWDNKTQTQDIVKFNPGERIPDHIEPIEHYESAEAAKAAALARGLFALPPKQK